MQIRERPTGQTKLGIKQHLFIRAWVGSPTVAPLVVINKSRLQKNKSTFYAVDFYRLIFNLFGLHSLL